MRPDFYKFFILTALAVAAGLVIVIGCGKKEDTRAGREAGLARIASERLPYFSDDLDLEGLAQGIEASISYYQGLPESRRFTLGSDQFSAGHMVRSLEHFLQFIQSRPDAAALHAHILENYRVYAFFENGCPVPVLFTGYFEPILNGGLTKTSVNRFPVYQRPSDLVTFTLSDFCKKCPATTAVGRYTGKTLVPYDTREAIEHAGSLAGRAEPIAWVDDPVDLFFLQIQGSGRIRLENGGMINLHYEVSNGHPYRSIGKYLIDHKGMQKDAVSMQSIRAYLKAHPEETNEVLSYNPRYVFFKVSDREPTGCLGVELTPGRSIATDQSLCPAGGLVFICTQKPVVDESGKIIAWTPFCRFVLNQDTGAAICGMGRADIFWGNGEYAELAAGQLKHPGEMYFLVLNPEVLQNR